MTEKIQYIPARLKNASVGGHVAGADDIMDDTLGKAQDIINEEHEEAISDLQENVGTGGSVDERIAAEKNRAVAAEQGLDTRLDVVEQLAEISIGGGDIGIATASDFDDPSAAQEAKVPTVAAVLGGISDGVFDLTAKTGDSYATLADALTAANTIIPVNKKKGGMEMRFVLTSGNTYVQYRLMLSEFTATQFTNAANWQGIDAEPTAGSKNLVESEGINKATVNKSITGDDNASVTLNVPITGERTYDVFFRDKLWDISGITFDDGNTILAISELDASYQQIGNNIYQIKKRDFHDNNLVQEHIITTSTNAKYLSILARATQGVKVYFSIDDITYLADRVNRLNSEVLDYTFSNSYEQGSYPTTATSIGFGAYNGQKLRATITSTGNLGGGWEIWGKKADGSIDTIVARYSAQTNLLVDVGGDYVDLLLFVRGNPNTGTVSVSIELYNFPKETEVDINSINGSLGTITAEINTIKPIVFERMGFAIPDYGEQYGWSYLVASNSLKNIKATAGHLYFAFKNVLYRINWGSSVSFDGLADGKYILVLVPNIEHPSSSTMELRLPTAIGTDGVVIAGVGILNEQVTKILFTNCEFYIGAKPAPEEDTTTMEYMNADKDAVALGAKTHQVYGKDGTNQFPTFLIVTDIHGNGSGRNFPALERAFGYAKNKSFVDTVLCLGDIGDDSHWLVGYDWSAKVLGCGKPVLTIPGNHEFIYRTGQDPSSPSYYTGFTDAQIFAKLCTADLLANNGETHGGTNHDKNYWYKDISKIGYDNVTRKIRVIGLYQYELSSPDADGNGVSRYKASGLYKQEQIDWFVNLLDTVESNMYVLVLSHSAVIGSNPILVDSAFSPKLFGWDDSYQMADTNKDFIAQIVNAWVTGVNGTFTDTFTYGDAISVTTNFSGAHANQFICFVGGHTHADYVFKHHDYDLYQVLLNCTALDQIQQKSDNPREYSGKFMDCVTLFTYDWFSHQVRLIRLGSDVTIDMRDRKYVSLNV